MKHLYCQEHSHENIKTVKRTRKQFSDEITKVTTGELIENYYVCDRCNKPIAGQASLFEFFRKSSLNDVSYLREVDTDYFFKKAKIRLY